MGFYDEAKERSVNRKGPGSVCSTGVALGTVDPDVADGIREAFNDPSILTLAISEALIEIGFDIAQTSVGRHRNRLCKCPTL